MSHHYRARNKGWMIVISCLLVCVCVHVCADWQETCQSVRLLQKNVSMSGFSRGPCGKKSNRTLRVFLKEECDRRTLVKLVSAKENSLLPEVKDWTFSTSTSVLLYGIQNMCSKMKLIPVALFQSG